ncbi:MAG: hypothetical protein AB9842_04455 [Bacteroidales bacterium]
MLNFSHASTPLSMTDNFSLPVTLSACRPAGRESNGNLSNIITIFVPELISLITVCIRLNVSDVQ